MTYYNWDVDPETVGFEEALSTLHDAAERDAPDPLRDVMRLTAQVMPQHDPAQDFRKTLEGLGIAPTRLYERSYTDPEIPTVLHPKQWAEIHSDHRYRWLFWANQSGKTVTGAIDCALTALGRHPTQHMEPPCEIWASALTWELWEQILLPELLTWLPPARVLDAPPPKRQSTKRTIIVLADNGAQSRIVGKSAEQGASKYQSARIAHAWLDEEHPESIWDELQPRLVRFGGRTIATMTPLLGMTWCYHRIYDQWKKGRI